MKPSRITPGEPERLKGAVSPKLESKARRWMLTSGTIVSSSLLAGFMPFENAVNLRSEYHRSFGCTRTNIGTPSFDARRSHPDEATSFCSLGSYVHDMFIAH